MMLASNTYMICIYLKFLHPTTFYIIVKGILILDVRYGNQRSRVLLQYSLWVIAFSSFCGMILRLQLKNTSTLVSGRPCSSVHLFPDPALPISVFVTPDRSALDVTWILPCNELVSYPLWLNVTWCDLHPSLEICQGQWQFSICKMHTEQF